MFLVGCLSMIFEILICILVKLIVMNEDEIKKQKES